MKKYLVLALVGLAALLSAAVAQTRSGIAPQTDQFSFSEISGSEGYYNTNGLTPRWTAINPATRTMVVIGAGQSNVSDYAGAIYIPTNTAVIDQLNIKDGALYPITGPMLGCSLNPNVGNDGGNVLAYVADKLVTDNRTDRVIVVPIAITATTVAQWDTTLSTRIRAAMNRLAARGITPSTPGVTFVLLWNQGENDNTGGTSQAAYTASFNSLVTKINSYGFSGYIFVSLQSYVAGVTSSAVRAAQNAAINGTTIRLGGDIDTIGSVGRPQDNIHLTTGTVPPLAVLSTGPRDAAALIVNAMHASGSPF